jgi:hypothetical protein
MFICPKFKLVVIVSAALIFPCVSSAPDKEPADALLETAPMRVGDGRSSARMLSFVPDEDKAGALGEASPRRVGDGRSRARMLSSEDNADALVEAAPMLPPVPDEDKDGALVEAATPRRVGDGRSRTQKLQPSPYEEPADAPLEVAPRCVGDR